MESKEDQILKQRISQYSPELQRLSKIDLLVDEKLNDVLSDLETFEITAISIYRALDKEFVKIPGTIEFLDNVVSLRRSRDRLGRQEFVEVLKKRPDYQILHSSEEESEIDQLKRSFFDKLKPWKWRR